VYQERIVHFPSCRVRPRATTRVRPRVAEHDLSPDQLSAIGRVMRLFIADDLANGLSPLAERPCDACGQERPAPGFVQYDELQLCNPCATAYEVQRARGLTRTIGGFLDQLRERHGA